MGTGRTFNKAPITRPKKKPIERRRREKNHRQRLVALGIPEDVVVRMTSGDMRELLKRPDKLRVKEPAGARE